MKNPFLCWIASALQLDRIRPPRRIEPSERQDPDLTEQKSAALDVDPLNVCGQDRDALIQKVRESVANYQQEREAAIQQAHVAAASGEGPQPYDDDWIETGWDVSEGIEEGVSKWSWCQVQEFVTILDWAMASPQAQRALTAEPGDPERQLWQPELLMIGQIRTALQWRASALLKAQAESLGQTWENNEDLLYAIDQL